MSTAPTRHAPSTVRNACDRCHAKKLRCSGGRSTCARCLRDDTQCLYSPALKAGRPTKSKTPATSNHEFIPPPASDAQDPSASSNTNLSITSARTTLELSGADVIDPFDDIEVIGLHPSQDLSNTAAFDLPDLDLTNFPLFPSPLPSQPTLPREVRDLVSTIQQLSELQLRLYTHRAALSTCASALRAGDPHALVDLSPPLRAILSDSHQLADTVLHLHSSAQSGGGGGRAQQQQRSNSGMLAHISDETSTFLLLAPLSLVLDIFAQILDLVAAALREAGDGGVGTPHRQQPFLAAFARAALGGVAAGWVELHPAAVGLRMATLAGVLDFELARLLRATMAVEGRGVIQEAVGLLRGEVGGLRGRVAEVRERCAGV